MDIKKVFITGIAGFIGIHLAKDLLDQGFKVIGIDNLNTYYYNVDLKYARLNELGIFKEEAEYYARKVESSKDENLSFYQLKLEDRAHKHNNEWGMWILYAWQKWAISQGFVNKN